MARQLGTLLLSGAPQVLEELPDKLRAANVDVAVVAVGA